MKTMGLRDLALRWRASSRTTMDGARAGADDILAAARVHDDLATAIADCGWVVGASARLRTIALPIVDPREAAASIWQRVPENRVAVLMRPRAVRASPTMIWRAASSSSTSRPNPEFSLVESRDGGAGAVLRAAHGDAGAAATRRPRQRQPARDGRRARALARAPRAPAHRLEFLHPAHQKQVKLKLRRIFHKATLEYNELNILRGALTSLDPSKRWPKDP